MGAYLYDEALLLKLRNWTSATNVMVYLQDDALDILAKQADNANDAPIKLPFICLRRDNGYRVITTGKRPLTHTGMRKEASSEKVEIINAIPIEISYSIDVYCRNFKEADNYMRNIIFNIVNYPKVTIDIPYNNLHMLHDSNIRITSEVLNTSPEANRTEIGQISRLTISIDIDDAYLWDIRVKDIVSIATTESTPTESTNNLIIMPDDISEELILN